MHMFRGGPLQIPGGGVTIPPKKFPQGKFFPKKIRASSTPSKKSSCKQGKVINQNENQIDNNFDRYTKKYHIASVHVVMNVVPRSTRNTNSGTEN